MLVLGALLVLVSFLSWFRLRYNIPIKGVPPRVVGYNGWRSGFLAWASVLVGMASAVFAGMRISGTQLKIRASAGAVYLLAGLAAFLMIALRFLMKPSLPILISQLVKITRGFGLYIALVITLAMLVTGFRAYQAERRR
jgi:hypothetical protein